MTGQYKLSETSFGVTNSQGDTLAIFNTSQSQLVQLINTSIFQNFGVSSINIIPINYNQSTNLLSGLLVQTNDSSWFAIDAEGDYTLLQNGSLGLNFSKAQVNSSVYYNSTSQLAYTYTITNWTASFTPNQIIESPTSYNYILISLIVGLMIAVIVGVTYLIFKMRSKKRAQSQYHNPGFQLNDSLSETYIEF